MMLIAAFVIVFLFEMLLPLALGLFFKEKFGAKWRVFFLGGLAFLASQVVHIPLLAVWQQLLLRWFSLEELSAPSPLLMAGLVLAVSFFAGLCEEPARWFAFKLLKADGQPSRHALMLGAGHGGIESMLVGVSAIGNAVTLVMLQNGSLPLASLTPAQTAALQELQNAAWYLPFWGGFERVLAIAFHVCASVIVWLGVRDKKLGYLFLAMGLHTLFNFVGVFSAQALQWPYWATEGLMALVVAGMVVGVVRLIRQRGMLSLYAEEKLNDDGVEFSGLFAVQLREAGIVELPTENEEEIQEG